MGGCECSSRSKNEDKGKGTSPLYKQSPWMQIHVPSFDRLVDSLDDKPMVAVDGGHKFIINPLTEQIPSGDAAILRDACCLLASHIDSKRTNKIVTEEDKGGIFLGGVVLLTGIAFGVARWQPTSVTDQVKEPFQMEYASGDIYLSGVQADNRITIIDDMLSTGGTLIALINAIEKIGAKIEDIFVIAEKKQYGGADRVFEKTGYRVKTFIKIDISGERSKVISRIDQNPDDFEFFDFARNYKKSFKSLTNR